MLIIIGILFIASIYLMMMHFGFASSENVHLPSELGEELKPFSRNAGSGHDFKTWLPVSTRFKTFEQKITANGLRRKLTKAGSPMGVLEFFSFKVLAVVTALVIAMIFLGDRFPKEIVFPISLGVGFLFPDLWLNKKIKKRQYSIIRDLPNVIDLLNLCVSGGMDFMLAVNKVVRDLRECDLTIELAEVYRQTQMGKTRRDALKNFAWRVDVPEIYSFVRTLMQADRMGSPMADALKQQADEVRTKRFHRGEAMALKAPIKLLFPLFAFILPVVLIIVGGPIMLEFMKSNLNFGF